LNRPVILSKLHLTAIVSPAIIMKTIKIINKPPAIALPNLKTKGNSTFVNIKITEKMIKHISKNVPFAE
jgi:hypothetical protein